MGEGRATFEAELGFTQGAAESPLLWIVFYDMVLDQLVREGVGQDIVTGACVGSGKGVGLEAFADDILLATLSREQCTNALRRTKAVLDLVGLRLAGHKSVHTAIR